MRTLLLLPVLLLGAALLFAACDDDDDDNGDSGGGETPGITSEAGDGNGADDGDDDDGTDAGGGVGGEPGPNAPTLSAGSASAATGAEGTVEINVAAFPAPGLGAWTIDIGYDPGVISIVECVANDASVCNAEYTDDSLRLSGATAGGIEGDFLLATITFSCDAEGTSPITIVIDIFADATIGGPAAIAANIEEGQVDCTAEPAP